MERAAAAVATAVLVYLTAERCGERWMCRTEADGGLVGGVPLLPPCPSPAAAAAPVS